MSTVGNATPETWPILRTSCATASVRSNVECAGLHGSKPHRAAGLTSESAAGGFEGTHDRADRVVDLLLREGAVGRLELEPEREAAPAVGHQIDVEQADVPQE